MTFKVIRGQGQGQEVTSVPYGDYFAMYDCFVTASDDVLVVVNTSLEELDLSWNCFRSRSAVALVRGLEVTD